MQFRGYELHAVGERLRACSRTVSEIIAGEVLVRVTGCGVCHTDIGFADGVRTRSPLPLILGHEITGIVEQGPVEWLGQAVIVPAVIPCGSCAACRRGLAGICAKQVMPGNDRDGGFASHVVVPAAGLCRVPGGPDPDAPRGKSGVTLRHLAVVADAVSTPYQSILRSGLRHGDIAVVVGLGGVGGYAAQIARALGAHVVALEVDPVKLARAEEFGATIAFDARQDARELRRQIRGFASEIGAALFGWVVLECSGTAAGQRTAYGLLVPGATLMVVGFTMDKVEIRLSNLMALDARAMGNWGCAPELYPAIVEMALEGSVDVLSHTELRPLDAISEAFDDARSHQCDRRVVLVPDGR